MTLSFEEAIGYRFGNSALLEEALNHPSVKTAANNQRLEFLGDSVLSMVVAHMLFSMYPQAPEGELARRLAALIRTETLAQVAREIDLGAMMQVGLSEERINGRDNPTNLEDSLEALIGAIYLDGGFEPARDFIVRHWSMLAESLKEAPKDAKTALQEWAQGKGMPLPVYRIAQQSGPPHAPVFTIEVSIEGMAPAAAEAGNKRLAEQMAAALLLEKLRGKLA